MPACDSTTCVIGDIHGCNTSLQQLLALVRNLADTFVFLGDYVDRGPDSRAVVTTLLAMKRQHGRVITLMGNHDLLFLQYLQGRGTPLFLEAGGLRTLASYGLGPEAGQEEMDARVPPDHRAFFETLPMLWEDRHGIYVHAGLDPGRPLSLQTQQWCLWVKDQQQGKIYSFGKPVVYGHTTHNVPQVAEDRIGIDTGAVFGGRLTALLLPQREFISVPGELTALEQS